MDDPRLLLGGARLAAESLTGQEALGEPSRFTMGVVSPEPLDAKALVGGPAAVLLGGDFDGLGRRSRVFQNLPVPDIVKKVLEDAPHPRRSCRLLCRTPHR